MERFSADKLKLDKVYGILGKTKSSMWEIILKGYGQHKKYYVISKYTLRVPRHFLYDLSVLMTYTALNH